ncbi:MAG TPA: type VII secretion target [Micromonosporaceae bacterium]|nr:type VII secretion target [Micromonosporaceae bacterium]
MTAPDGREREVLGLVDFASRLLATGETLGDTAVGFETMDRGRAGLGIDAPGVLGELGRHLHGQWTSALRARAGEARREAARIVELAERLGKAAANYADTDITLSTRIARAESDSGADPHELTVRPDRRSP